MKFINSDRTAASYTIIGTYIVNANTHQIAKFHNSAEAIDRGVIDIPSLEKLTAAYKANPSDFKNITERPHSIDELLKETNGNTFLLSVIGMETDSLKTIKSLINYGNSEIISNMIHDNDIIQRYPSLVDRIIKKYSDDKEVLSYFTSLNVIEFLPNSIINRLFDIGDPDITYSLIAYNRLSKKDLEPLFNSDNVTILEALAQFAQLNESQRESFLHHENSEVQLAFRRREDITPEEDQYLWDNVVIRLQREDEAKKAQSPTVETAEQPSFKP